MPGLIWSAKGDLLRLQTTDSYPITRPDHCWSMDETGGIRADHIGNIDLYPYGSPEPGSVPGVLGNAASFNIASENYLKSQRSVSTMELRGDFTLAVWLYPLRDDNTVMFPVSKFSSSVRGEYAIWLKNGTATFRIYRGGFYDTNPVSCPKNQWSLIICEYNAATRTSTIHNMSTGDTGYRYDSPLPDAISTYLSVGEVANGTVWPEFFFDGYIGPLKIWHQLLSISEHDAIFNNGAGLACPDEQPLTFAQLLPNGTADGQIWHWNATAAEWQIHALTPGDIGAAAAAHTHDWSGITRAETGYQSVAVGGSVYPSILGYNESALVLLSEFESIGANQTASMYIHTRSAAGNERVRYMTGVAFGTVIDCSFYSCIGLRYDNTYNQTIMLHWLVLKYGEGA